TTQDSDRLGGAAVRHGHRGGSPFRPRLMFPGWEKSSMRHLPVHVMRSLAAMVIAFCCSSCQDGKRLYPVRGHVFVNGKPADGLRIVFHPQDDSDSNALRPSATVLPDGSFTLRSYLVKERVLKEGAPAGQYQVTCVWYPPDLENYLKVD